jgi:hypothetical protein
VPALLRLVKGDASGLAGLPGGSLIVLSTGPLGGVRDINASEASSTVNRLSLPNDDQRTDAATTPALFVQDGFFAGGDGAGIFINWEPILRGYRRLLDGLWKASVEEVPTSEDDDATLPAGREEPDDPFSAVGDDSTEADAWEDAVAYAPSDATWGTLTANRLLMPGLFVLGALGGKGRDDRRGSWSAVRDPWSAAKDLDKEP